MGRPTEKLPDHSSGPATNWNHIWNYRITRYRQANGGGDCADQWQNRERALAYWKMATETQQERVEATLAGLSLSPGSRVLDIGSGPGVMAIPLARQVSHVTAVDASHGMISVLQDQAAVSGLTNINCVNKRWEDVSPAIDTPGHFDVVLAALSLGMYDLSAAVDKMEQVCRGYIYLYWFAGKASWEGDCGFLRPFMPERRQRAALPKGSLLLKLLRQKGIEPHIDQFQYVHMDRFHTVNDAVDYFIRRYRIPANHHTRALRDAVSRFLEKQHDMLVLRSRATCLKIWWQARQTRMDA